MSSYFQTGNDLIRVNGEELTKASGTDTGGTSMTDGVVYLGDISTSTLGFRGRIAEFLLFNGTVTTDDRNLIEASQIVYGQNGKRLVMHGDSLARGTGLTGGEASEDDASVGAITRNLLGEGWDFFPRGWGGASLNNISPAANLTTQLPIVVDPLYRPDGLKNILVLWTGWNDMQGVGGVSALTFLTNLATYTSLARAIGWKVVFVSCPPADYAGQADYSTKRLTVNAAVATDSIIYCDAYADTSADAIIGDDANTSDTTYWTDKIHMTNAGYALVAPYIYTAVASL